MNLNYFLFFCLLLTGTDTSYATCQREDPFLQPQDPIAISTVGLPDNLVVESRDYAAGEVVYQTNVAEGSSSPNIVSCGRNYVVGWFYLNEPQASMSSGSSIAPTNIPGLGVRVTTENQAGPYDYPRFVQNDWEPGDGGADHKLNHPNYMVEFVAFGGPISSGKLTLGSPFAQVEFREQRTHNSGLGDIASQLALSPNTEVVIKAMGCAADTSMIRFPFGTMNLNQFTGVTTVSGAPEQTVKLSCEPGSNVNLSVTAEVAQGDNANDTVIALSGSGTEGVASGIGVQLELNVNGTPKGPLALNKETILLTPASLRRSLTEMGERIGTLYESGGSTGQETLTFSARYYKTAATVTAGTANATATLNLTYN